MPLEGHHAPIPRPAALPSPLDHLRSYHRGSVSGNCTLFMQERGLEGATGAGHDEYGCRVAVLRVPWGPTVALTHFNSDRHP